MDLARAEEKSPLDEVTIESLDARHPCYQEWHRAWADYRLLYEGGLKFLRAAGQTTAGYGTAESSYSGQSMRTKLRRFLYQLDGEPNEKYTLRWNRSHYEGYLPAIVDYFVAWLFSSPPIIRPQDSVEMPEWWPDFAADCTGAGVALLDFVRGRFLDALIVQRAGWLIAKSDTGLPILTAYDAENILDWQHDDQGELEWVLLRRCEASRAFPASREETEIYTYVDRNEWRSWQVRGDGKEQAQTLIPIDGDVHGLGVVPFVQIEIPPGMWIANKLASWQVDLFNKVNMLSYAQLMGCFLQPYIKSPEDGAENRIFGEGVLLHLRSTERGEEDFGWKSPDVGPLEHLWDQIKEMRDEGYRISHQMALAVDATAINAVGRSGASKVEDRRSTEIILGGYGAFVRDAIVRTASIISLIVGDDVKWQCDGFDNFDVSSLNEELQNAGLVDSLGIPSPTFEKKLKTQIAYRLLEREDEQTRDDVAKEIEDAIDQKNEAREQLPPMPPLGELPPEGGPVEEPDDLKELERVAGVIKTAREAGLDEDIDVDAYTQKLKRKAKPNVQGQ